MPPTLKIIKPCIGESFDGKTKVEIPVGTECEYCGHVPGGMVAVMYGDQKLIVHPAATDIG